MSGGEIRKVSAPDTFSERAKVEPRDVASRFEGVESVDAAFLIVLAPFLAFPIILVSGQLYNGNSTWKQNLKEGGVIGLSALLVSLTLAVRHLAVGKLHASQHLDLFAGNGGEVV